jgi:molybdenum cofactor cytidylyltransferase
VPAHPHLGCDHRRVTASRRIAGLVLAAGAGRRFGGPKQLAPLHGRPLLEHALRTIAAVPALERVVVALGAHADEILARVDLQGAEPLVVEDWAEGQAASLRAGVARLAADDALDAIVVTLGDQPGVSTEAIGRVVAAWDGVRPAVRATCGGAPGHPVLLARALFPALLGLRGDAGARGVLAHADVLDVVGDASALLDVDTPAELQRLRGGSRG